MPTNFNDYDLIIFDADGTLRRCTVADQPCPYERGQWEVIRGVMQFITEHVPQRILLGIVSNQAPVYKGLVTERTAKQLLVDLADQAFSFCPPIDFIQLCPHQSKGSTCLCRKPQPGMLLHIMNAARKPPERVLYVGDLPTDEEAAQNAGVHFAWAWDFFGKTKEEWVGWLGRRADEDRSRAFDERSRTAFQPKNP